MHVDRIALGVAGVAAVTITSAGVVLDDLQIAPGWVAHRSPKLGLLRRARPREFARVILRQGEGPLAPEHELEVARLDDGSWELAVRDQWTGDATRTVPTPAGEVACRLEGGRLAVDHADARDGWTARAEAHDGDEVVVVFTRGGGVSTEDWEVVVLTDIDGSGTPMIEREHRWRIPPQG